MQTMERAAGSWERSGQRTQTARPVHLNDHENSNNEANAFPDISGRFLLIARLGHVQYACILEI